MKLITLLLALVAVAALSPAELHAYLGPGAGLSAFGALLALIASLLVGIFGFVWYPVKRVMRALRKRREAEAKVPADSMPS